MLVVASAFSRFHLQSDVRDVPLNRSLPLALVLHRHFPVTCVPRGVLLGTVKLGFPQLKEGLQLELNRLPKWSLASHNGLAQETLAQVPLVQCGLSRNKREKSAATHCSFKLAIATETIETNKPYIEIYPKNYLSEDIIVDQLRAVGI